MDAACKAVHCRPEVRPRLLPRPINGDLVLYLGPATTLLAWKPVAAPPLHVWLTTPLLSNGPSWTARPRGRAPWAAGPLRGQVLLRVGGAGQGQLGGELLGLRSLHRRVRRGGSARGRPVALSAPDIRITRHVKGRTGPWRTDRQRSARRRGSDGGFNEIISLEKRGEDGCHPGHGKNEACARRGPLSWF